MAGEIFTTIKGNLIGDPELRFTPSGAAVANFRVASNPKTFNRQTNEWVDGNPLFINCSVWRQQAENVTESLARGDRVILEGILSTRTYETKEGEKRSVTELEVTEIGPSLKFATAKPEKLNRPAPAQQQSVGQGGSGWGSQAAAPGTDPWASPGGRGTPQQANYDEPPF